jgi:hypothetical protein
MCMLTSIQAAKEFEGVIPVFREAWRLAWVDILGKFNEPGWDNSCRSQVLQMQAVIHAKELFHGNSDVNHFKVEVRNLFLIREAGLFGLKQFDENHCTKNYATDGAKLFDSQSELPGLGDYQRYTVGILAQEDWTDYVGIYMACPRAIRQRPNWVLDITGEPVDIESLQSEFNESISQPTERRFKPLRKQSEERADDTGV